MKMINCFFVLLLLCFPISMLAVSRPVSPILERFEYSEVRLKAGDLKRQMDETCEYYLHISNDDLLKGFRERAGLPTHGAKNLGGWYSDDVFHVFGQFLSGLSRLYAATGNEECQKKLNELIEGWAETIAPDGYFFYSQKPNAPHYVYEKMQTGLLDAYLFADNKTALKYMEAITDWAIKNLHKERKYPYTPGQRNIEWYTLSENLYRAYLATGDQKYFDFAAFWEYPDFWDAMRAKKDIFAEKVFYHAYSHLNCLSGAAMAYKVKADEKYLNTIICGYDFFMNSQTYITGGFGPTEQLVSSDDKRNITNFTHHSFETQCGSWAGFKLSKYLIEYTGNGMYGDWIEKLIINGIGASIPMSPTGAVMYYSDYNCKYATKHNYNKDWSCCTGTRPQAIADYVNLIYFKDNNGIYINYFTPSVVNWNGTQLEQSTTFPEEPATRITVNTSHPKTFDINIRKPLWLDGEMSITVNGEKVSASERNGWIVLNRTWKQGDKVEAIMPMSFHNKRLHPDSEYPVAMAYGPVALVITSSDDSYPISAVDVINPGENLIPDANKKMTWHVQSHPEWLVRGYYQLMENEPYVFYVDPRAEGVIPNDSIRITDDWNPRSFYASNKTGGTISTGFTGRGVRIFCYKNRNGGMAKVEIDGKDVGTIDLYGDGERMIVPFEFNGLSKKQHKIKLTILTEKNKNSKGTSVIVLGFEAVAGQ